jgi:PAS domain S-box-containing protein
MVVTAPNESLSAPFSAAFAQSRNAMALVDDRRRLVDANAAYLRLLGYRRELIVGRPIYRFVAGGPLALPAEWKAALASGRFTGEADLLCATGDTVAVQWAATTELVTGRYLALFVALSTHAGRRLPPDCATLEHTGSAVCARARVRYPEVGLTLSGGCRFASRPVLCTA